MAFNRETVNDQQLHLAALQGSVEGIKRVMATGKIQVLYDSKKTQHFSLVVFDIIFFQPINSFVAIGQHFKKASICHQADLCSFIRLGAASICVKVVQKQVCKSRKNRIFRIIFQYSFEHFCSIFASATFILDCSVMFEFKMDERT